MNAAILNLAKPPATPRDENDESDGCFLEVWRALHKRRIQGAPRVGKHTSTISGELRRNAATVTPNDRLLDFGVKRLWSEEQLDEYVSTLPSEEQRTHHVWGGFRLPKRYRKRKRRRRPQVTSCGAGLREVEEHGRRASLELALRELGGPRALTVDNGKELYGSRVSVAFDR